METITVQEYKKNNPINYLEAVERASKSICTILREKEGMGFGFFCKIGFSPHKNSHYLLIINNIFLKEEDIALGKEIKIIANNIETILTIDKSRIIHREDKKDGITIIEIKPSDNIDINSFLEIEYNTVQEFSENKYKNKMAYLIKYQYEKNPELFKKKIINVNSENYEIENVDSKEEISIGSPIINLDNFKIIGMYKGYDNKKNLNIGIFIQKLIKEYIIKKMMVEQKINENNSITIFYESLRRVGIKLFDKRFVENNKNLCTIVINGKEREICEYIENDDIRQPFLAIKLKNLDKIENPNFMFYECKYLYALPDLEKWNTSSVKSMRSLFNHCISLKLLSGMENWNTSNVDDMNYMFCHCSSLEELPDISNWKTDNVKFMSNLFSECSSLKKIPDISNWNISNVVNLSYLFCNCSLITCLPDISRWNTINVEDISHLFSLCKNLEILPDISKWKTNNINNMMQIFEYCSSLQKLPDISIWDTNKVTNFMGIFHNCSLLLKLPDISKWNMENAINIEDMLKGCTSLRILPDISKWKIINVINMSSLFEGCISLSVLPDISKWKINKNNNINIGRLFCNCSSLLKLPDISKWETHKITDMSYMFKGCYSLVIIPNIQRLITSNRQAKTTGILESCISLL